MDYEQKYKALVGKIEKAYLYAQTDSTKAVLEEIRSELKESEDEKIRKEIVDFINRVYERQALIITDEEKDSWIAWLEKQKEFVSADFDDVWETADCDELTAPLEKYSKDAIKEMCHAWYDKGIELERKSWLEKQGEQKTAVDTSMIDFEKLGFKDITKDNPIHFFECFGESFPILYPYEKRFYKKENDVITILKVGIQHKFVDIAGICHCPKGWHKFEVHTLADYADEELEQIIKAVKFKINKL